MAQYGIKTICKEDGWEFSQFSGAPQVMIAETKMKSHDEIWLEELENILSKKKYRVFIDGPENERKRNKRKTTRIEVYKRFSEGTVNEQITRFLQDFSKIS